MADDIAQWLEEIGLGRYAPAFVENDIDLAVLSRLTDDDLKELGLSIGHRRKLQAAIEHQSADELPAQPGAHRAREPEPQPAEAERRQLTVLFCDLVGSTALSSRLDPEDMREVLRAYQEACSDVIVRFDGYVAKFMGDGVYAYFGYPRAHEDDAERAINAGLGIVEAVKDLDTRRGDRRDLAVRIGVATGTVAVGDIIGEGASEEANVVGEAPNLAARLQGIAEPNSVVIGEATHTLAGGLFETTNLGKRALKGFAQPIGAWSVVRPRRTESRFEAARGAKLTDLVGREDEVALLLRRWDGAKSGKAQFVLLSGEAGIGKSRVTQALRQRISDQPHTRISFQCSPFFTNRALHPIIQHLERAAGLGRDDSDHQKAEKLEAMIRLATEDVGPLLPWLAALLSIQVDDRYAVPDVSPQMRKQRTYEALYAQLSGLAGREPVLLVLEDAHWIDNTTLEWMQLLVDRLERERVLVIVTFRPEFTPSWIGEPHVTSLTLNRLDRGQCTAMVDRIADASLSRDIVEEIVNRADGVPLFVEELTATVVESGQSENVATVPETLQDAMMARLDQMGAARELAQVASVIGRQFGHGLLASAADQSDTELAQNLERLVRSGLVQVRGTPPDATYAFRHALLRDTAYGSLLRSQRREWHARIASAIERNFADTAPPEILAHHLTEAGAVNRAISYWHSAGRQAVGRSANIEAINHLEKALELLGTLPDTEDLARQELAVVSTLGPAAIGRWGPAGPGIQDLHERALRLADRIGDPSQKLSALFGLWASNAAGGTLDRARVITQQIGTLADETGDVGHRLQSHHAAWTTEFFLGDVEACYRETQSGVPLYDIDEHASHALSYGGHDPGICGLNIAAFSSWVLGYPDRARKFAEESSVLGEKVAHKFSQVLAYLFPAQIHLLRGETALADELAGRALKMSTELGLPLLAPSAVVQTSARLSATNDQAALEGLLERIVAPWPGTEPFRIYWLSASALRLAGVGRFDDALSLFERAERIAEGMGVAWTAPELLRHRGEMLRLQGASETEADAKFREAMETARAMNAKTWELRAAASQARLRRDGGKLDEGRAILAPLFDWFTEGFDTADLKDAKALLDELS